MPKYKIAENRKGLTIEIEDIAGQEQQLLDEFQKCQSGQCSCQTNEYEKLDTLKFEQSAGKIQLSLTAKQGETFDKGEITHCLDHTTQNLKKDNA